MGRIAEVDEPKRIQWIHELLRLGQPVNCTDLARNWRVNPRTIARTIRKMREKNYPIVWDPNEESYKYSKDVFLVEPKVFCGRDELISVVLASSMMENFRFAQLAAPMNNLKSFLFNDTKDGPQQHQKWQEKFSYMPAPPAIIDRTTWETVVNALVRDHKLCIMYEKADGQEPVERVVYPLHLRGFLSGWYLVAHCTLRDDQRTFNMHRIAKVEDMDELFVRASYPFDQETYFQRKTQVFRAERLTPVRLRFAREAVKRGLEVEWFDQQKITRRADGTMDLSFEVARLDGVADFVLRWRGQVQVVNPPALKDLVRDAVRQLHASFS